MQHDTLPTTRATNNAAGPSAATTRILIADADPDTRELYRLLFERIGCDVVEAADGRIALSEVLVRPPTLVVTEIRLPFVDGPAFCEILRRDRTTSRVPILVVTSETRPIEVDRARSAGADVVLVKPTDVEQILDEVRRLVAAKDPHERVAAEQATAAPRDEPADGTLRPSTH
jgi:chemotaxis family two-component system response regulator PixH